MLKPSPVDLRNLQLVRSVGRSIVVAPKVPTLGVAIAILAVAVVVAASPAWADEASGRSIAVPTSAQPDADDWQFALAPYAWFTSITGTMAFRDNASDVDVPFDALWKQLHMGLFLEAEVRRGDLGFFSDLMWTYLWQRKEGILTYEIDIDMVILDFAFYHEIVTLTLGTGASAPRLRLQPFVGGRYVHLGLDVDVNPVARNLRPASDTAAPILGLRAFLDFGDRWNLSFIGDGGGFGVDGLDSTWQAELLAGYRFRPFGRDLNLMAGYKGLGLESTSDGIATDLTLHGPVLKLGFEF